METASCQSTVIRINVHDTSDVITSTPAFHQPHWNQSTQPSTSTSTAAAAAAVRTSSTPASSVDSLRAVSLNKLDGVMTSGCARDGSVHDQRSTPTGNPRLPLFDRGLPFKCPSYPRLERRSCCCYPADVAGLDAAAAAAAAVAAAIDASSMSPRLSSNLNLSQDLDGSEMMNPGSSTASINDIVSCGGFQDGAALCGATEGRGGSGGGSSTLLTRSVSVRCSSTRGGGSAQQHSVCGNVTSTAAAVSVDTAPAVTRLTADVVSQVATTTKTETAMAAAAAHVTGIAVRLIRSLSCPCILLTAQSAVSSTAGCDGFLLPPSASRRPQQAELGPPAARGSTGRRRSEAIGRDVNLEGEIIVDLPVAPRADYPDFDPAAAAATAPVAVISASKMASLSTADGSTFRPRSASSFADLNNFRLSSADGCGCDQTSREWRRLSVSHQQEQRHLNPGLSHDWGHVTTGSATTAAHARAMLHSDIPIFRFHQHPQQQLHQPPPASAASDVQIKCLQWLHGLDRQQTIAEDRLDADQDTEPLNFVEQRSSLESRKTSYRQQAAE